MDAVDEEVGGRGSRRQRIPPTTTAPVIEKEGAAAGGLSRGGRGWSCQVAICDTAEMVGDVRISV